MTQVAEPEARLIDSPAQCLRTTMAAVRVSLSWYGVRKTLTAEQKHQAADAFGAQAQYLSAGKKLLDTGHPAFRAVTAVKNRVIAFWKSMSLPYPEPGIRLIRQDRIDMFDTQMRGFREELSEAVAALQRHYDELKDNAERRLGSLFNRGDYPDTLQGLFQIHFDFPSVEPPDYLQQLNPSLFRAECERVAARFDEAVQMAEDAFCGELTKLVAHLAERLAGQADGKPKIFRDSAVTNLVEFFDRFRQLNIRSNDELEELVQRAQQVIEGRVPNQLRDNQVLRQTVAQELTEVQDALEGLLVDRPRRNILRRARSQEAA